VGTDLGGTVEILSSLRGDPDVPATVRVPSGDEAALAGATVEWAALPADALSTAGRARRRYTVENYTWRRTVTRLAGG
jgi:glycosyltransferase involved in cell wall biosynthesis